MLKADIEGFVLTGGASARMGSPKALIEFSGKTLGRRAIEVLGPTCSRVCTVGDIAIDGFESLTDIRSSHEKASILGLYSALKNCHAEFCAVVACDLPFVTPEVFGLLISHHQPGIEAVIPRDINSWPQPFCAVYSTDPALAKLEHFLAGNGREVREFLRRLNVIYLGIDQLTRMTNYEVLFFNINTPEDLEQAKQMTL